MCPRGPHQLASWALSGTLACGLGCQSQPGTASTLPEQRITATDAAAPSAPPDVQKATAILELSACAQSRADALLLEYREIVAAGSDPALARFARMHGNELLDWLNLALAARLDSIEPVLEIAAWSSDMGDRLDDNPAAALAVFDKGSQPSIDDLMNLMEVTRAIAPPLGSQDDLVALRMQLSRLPETSQSPSLTAEQVAVACPADLDPHLITELLLVRDSLRPTRLWENTE